MNSESSESENHTPSKELVQGLGWKEESPGVYVGGSECSDEFKVSDLVVDPAEWDEKLNKAEAEAAELLEQQLSENVSETAPAVEPVEGSAVGIIQSEEDDGNPQL